MSSLLPPFLTYHPQYGLIICSTHQTALHKTKILDHVTKDHPGSELNQSDLDAYHLSSLLAAHHMIQADQPIHPILSLKAAQEGFQCNRCHTIRLKQRKIRDHLLKDHHLRGYQAQDLEATPCLVQALEGSAYLFRVTQDTLPLPALPTRKRSRELSLPSASLAPTPQRPRGVAQSTPDDSAIRAAFLAGFGTFRQSLKESRVIQAFGETYEARGFFTESQYPAFLSGRDSSELEALFTLESPSHMTWLSAIVYRLLLRGDALISRTTTQSLSALNTFSQDPINQASLRPLRSLQTQHSLQQYRLVFQAFLNFLLTSFRSLQEEGPDSYTSLYILGPSQLSALEALETFLSGLPEPDPALVNRVEAAYQPARYPACPPVSDFDSSDSSDSDSSDNKAIPDLPQATFENTYVDQGVGLVMKLALSLVQHQIIDQSVMPLYAFFACYSRNYSRDCFKRLDKISGAYSAIIKCYQFIILYWLHTEPFADPKPDESMASFIQTWMRQYFTAQSESPLGHVLVLRGLAFTVMKSSTSLGRIHILAPHTLRYAQITISQQDLRVFLTKAISKLALELSNELFLDFANFQQVSLTLYIYIYISLYACYGILI